MGRKDPSQPSYWVYTHKVFAIYYDPVTRRVLDASMEVSELRHVSAAEKLIFRQSVFWLPRAEADFKPRTMLGKSFSRARSLLKCWRVLVSLPSISPSTQYSRAGARRPLYE